jgi:L-aminopeptidase/D-esterase-like protein
MPQVYSTRFAAGAIGAGDSAVVYTVPSGVTAVVRDVKVHCGSATAALFTLTIVGIANALVINTTDDGTVPLSDMRIVLNAGDQLQVSATSEGFEYVISGYQLT